METIDKIINTLKNKHIIQEQVIEWTEIKSGTTDGKIYRLSSEKKPLYVLKKMNLKLLPRLMDFLKLIKTLSYCQMYFTRMNLMSLLFTRIFQETLI